MPKLPHHNMEDAQKLTFNSLLQLIETDDMTSAMHPPHKEGLNELPITLK